MPVDLSKIADFPKMLIRLPPDLRDRIAESAKSRGRSVNADVIARIEASFKADEDAYDSLQSGEDLREFVNARLDEADARAREMRLSFEYMLAEAKKVFGEDLVSTAQARAKEDVAHEAQAPRTKTPQSPASEKAREVLRNRPRKANSETETRPLPASDIPDNLKPRR